MKHDEAIELAWEKREAAKLMHMPQVERALDWEPFTAGARWGVAHGREEAGAIKSEVERIKAEAHVKGDHLTYDLMRTILAAAIREDNT